MAASASAAQRAAENASVGSTTETRWCRHPGQLRRLRLGRAEVEVPVHRLRVGADDLRAQPLRQLDGQLGLPGAGRAGDDGEGWLG